MKLQRFETSSLPGTIPLREARAIIIVATGLLEDSMRGASISTQEKRHKDIRDFLALVQELRQDGRL